MICVVQDCKSPATVIVFWPGKASLCAIHAISARDVAAAMGFEVSFEPLAALDEGKAS